MLYNFDELEGKELKKTYDGRVIKFDLGGEVLYYKRPRFVDYYYNEVLAYKIGTSLNYNMTPYDFASYQDSIGWVSKNILNNSYVNMDDLLNRVYSSNTNKKNNLCDIKQAFEILFLDKSDLLFEQLIDIFLFDVLIGNSDRHTENYGLFITEADVSFAPLFDHENMLDDRAIYDGEYCLGIDSGDYYNWQENLFYKFLDKYGSDYADKMLRMLPVISEANLLKMFSEFEEETDVNDSIKEKVLKRFAVNETMIRRGLS